MDKKGSSHVKGEDKKKAIGDIPVSQLIQMTKKRSRSSSDGLDMENSGTDKKKKKSKSKSKKKKMSKTEHNTALDTVASVTTAASLSPNADTSETDPFPYLEEDCCETQSVA